jgi:hypothetical protein
MAVGFSIVQGAVAVIVIPFPALAAALQRPGPFAILVRGRKRDKGRAPKVPEIDFRAGVGQ